jgi:acetoin utilization protein AcuB
MSVTIQDLMLREPLTLRGEQTIFTAREVMLLNGYETLYVVDEEGKPVGILDALLASSKKSGKVASIMQKDFPSIPGNAGSQEAAAIFTDKSSGHQTLPVVNDQGILIGILRVKDLLVDLSSTPGRRRKGQISPESAVIRLAMTETEEDEKNSMKMIRDLNFKPGVTQVGANAEKLALKMRESAIVAAIAHGVIREETREKVAVSNAIRDIILQLGMLSPGLGGGYKLAMVRGEGRLSVCAFGRCGHALANSSEQIFLGSSII